MADVDVQITGPLFDGRAERVLDTAAREAQEAVAQRAVIAVREIVGREAKHPTGRYARHVVADQTRGDQVRVHTPGLVYGPWIAGVSRRNQVSSFKGLKPFRRARDEVNSQAGRIAGEVIGRRVKELNG